jgi:hypothetical protein
VSVTQTRKQTGDEAFVSAMRQRLQAVSSEIESAERHLAELKEQKQPIEQAFQLVGDGTSESAAPSRRRRSSAARAPHPASASRRRGSRTRHPGNRALLTYVRKQGSARVADITERYGVTPLTARSWLKALSQDGQLQESMQGGVAVWQLPDGDTEPTS